MTETELRGARGPLPAIFAAAAIAASSVTVVSNALCLRGFRARTLREPPPRGRRLAPA